MTDNDDEDRTIAEIRAYQRGRLIRSTPVRATMTDTPKPIAFIKSVLDDYMAHTPNGWSDMIAEMLGDPVDIDHLRAAVVADSPELARERIATLEARVLVLRDHAEAADADRAAALARVRELETAAQPKPRDESGPAPGWTVCDEARGKYIRDGGLTDKAGTWLTYDEEHGYAPPDEAAIRADERRRTERDVVAHFNTKNGDTIDDLLSDIERVCSAPVDEPRLLGMRMAAGEMEIDVEHVGARLLAASFRDSLERLGAENYIELRLTSRTDPPLPMLVTIQRIDGKTPHELRHDAEQRAAALEAEKADLVKSVGDEILRLGESGERIRADERAKCAAELRARAEHYAVTLDTPPNSDERRAALTVAVILLSAAKRMDGADSGIVVRPAEGGADAPAAAVTHHSGIAASWCPICGDCTCPREEDGEPVVRTSERATIVCPWPATSVVHDPTCPLHGADSAAHCSAGDPPEAAPC